MSNTPSAPAPQANNPRFLACLVETLKWEGGYSNNPADPGGPTMKGIIQREYDAWRKARGLPSRDVRHIGDAEVATIYHDEYWVKAGCGELPAGLDLGVFDAAVNNGVHRALSWLPVASSDAGKSAPQNGAPGIADAIDIYLPVAASVADAIDIYMDARLDFDMSLHRLWRVFGAGWTRRIAGIREAAKIMAGVPVEDA